MSLSIEFFNVDDSDGPFALASARGWTLFGLWVEMVLPKDDYHVMRELVEEGSVEGTDLLSEELTRALLAYAPTNSAVADTGNDLLENLGAGAEDETAVVLGEDSAVLGDD